MKRGKDEERVMGPMFPRLHVNDTEKGGPRAPPRNKMALYEQLSIPSQRFNHSMPPNSSGGNSVPPPSQRVGNERGTFFSRQLPPSHQSDKQYSQYTDYNTPLKQTEPRKKSDDDDFTVPIFIHSFPSNDMGIEKLGTADLSHFSHSPKSENPKDTSMLSGSMRQEGKNQQAEDSTDFLEDHIRLVENSLIAEKTESLKDQSESSMCRELGDNRAAVSKENITLMEKRNFPTSLLEDENVARDLSNETESRGDGSCRSMQMGNLERADSLSETSNLDSLSGQDVITPDDVVGVIGQKHFWKARRAITSQQRVFAVQVFELHRLLKVQRLIAASPHLLIEESAYLGKSIKSLPTKKTPLDYPIKVIPNITKQKSNVEKPNHNNEKSAENTLEKSLPSPIQNGVPSSNHPPLPPNSPAPSMSSDNSARPWCFSPQVGQQWLVPVMSPSEGLVYKPYPGPGFGGPACGPPAPAFLGPTCGPPGSNPMMGNFMPPPYGIPAPHHQYQVPHFPPNGVHSYFPYGMPMMNTAAFSNSSVEQMPPPQFSAVERNVSGFDRHNSYSKPSRANGPGRDAFDLNMCDEVDVQASTGSCPSEKVVDARGSGNVEGRNVLSLFPTSPVVSSPSLGRGSEPESPARVIKVVPHNPRSATESAARIFQSIQEERKQYDSM